MPYSIEKVPDAPIVILVQENRLTIAEMSRMIDTLTLTLNAQPEPIYLVMDVQVPAFAPDDMSIAASAIARRESALLLHKNIRETLLVTRNGAVRLSALGLGTAVLGQAHIRRIDTMEKALAFCRMRPAVAAG